MDTLKKIISCLVALCLTLAMLLGLCNLTVKKDSYAKHAEFFEQEADYDALFFGASHMMNAVLPMELWNDHGIASYNMAQAGHTLPASYWVMRLSLEHYKPKLVVIDCFSMEFPGKSSSNFSLMHISLDSFPMSITKLQAIKDIMDDPSVTSVKNLGEDRGLVNLIWSFSVFHSRWNSLEKDDFQPQKSYSRGALTNIDIVPGHFERVSADEKTVVKEVGESYLRRMIEYCQSQEIDVLLTFIPFPDEGNQQKKANYVDDIATEYGIDYLNFMNLDILDYSVDVADDNLHLNVSGARKISDYLGDYMKANYAFTDHRNDEAYINWTNDFEQYTALKDADICSQTELYHSLLLLCGDNIDAVIDINDKDLYKDALVLGLLKSLGFESDKLDSSPDKLVVSGGRAAQGNSEETAIVTDTEHDISISVKRNGSVVDTVAYNYVYDSQNSCIQQIECIR